jgi:hypothetical protein
VLIRRVGLNLRILESLSALAETPNNLVQIVRIVQKPRTLNNQRHQYSNQKNLFNWCHQSAKRGYFKFYLLIFVKKQIMEIIQVEIKNKNALAILKSMERALMIRLIKQKKSTGKDLSKLKGVFSPEKAKELAGLVDKSRDEWNQRTI